MLIELDVQHGASRPGAARRYKSHSADPDAQWSLATFRAEKRRALATFASAVDLFNGAPSFVAASLPEPMNKYSMQERSPRGGAVGSPQLGPPGSVKALNLAILAGTLSEVRRGFDEYERAAAAIIALRFIGLVHALVDGLEGREVDAMRWFEQAIHSARDNGFVQNEALACERYEA